METFLLTMTVYLHNYAYHGNEYLLMKSPMNNDYLKSYMYTYTCIYNDRYKLGYIHVHVLFIYHQTSGFVHTSIHKT